MAIVFPKVGFALTAEHDDLEFLTPTSIAELAAFLDLRPTKKWGQNFVHDANTVRSIVARAGVTADDHVLEIGPGLGSLTLACRDVAKQVTVVEIDPRLARLLPETLATLRPGCRNVTVVNADALTVDASVCPPEQDPPTVCVANLPYNVSVPVLLHVLATFPSVRSGLVMVQAEVADRLAAGPGSKTYGAPSAKLAWYCEAERVASVPRGVFWPVPRVDSALVAFRRRPLPCGDVQAREVFAVIDAAFSQRRKTLRSALASWAGSSAKAEDVLREAGVDPGLRGERLGIEEFVAIARAAQGLW